MEFRCGLLALVFSLSTGVTLLANSDETIRERMSFIAKPGLELHSAGHVTDLEKLRQAFESLIKETVGEFGEIYDRTMAAKLLRNVAEPSKAWWDQICPHLNGAVPEDVSEGMSSEEIQEIFIERVAGAKARTMSDLESLLLAAIDEKWGRSIQFGHAANCDPGSTSSYVWSDPTVVAIASGSRKGSKMATTTSLGGWKSSRVAVAEFRYHWILGEARFSDSDYERTHAVEVQAEVHSSVSLSVSCVIGIGDNQLEYRVRKGVDTKATNYPDTISTEFVQQ